MIDKEKLIAKEQEIKSLQGELWAEKKILTELDQENAELKKSVMKQCPICGEKFLSPIGMELYDKNICYKQALEEIEEYCQLGGNVCLTDCPEYAVGQGCSKNCFENRLKIFLAIINKAYFGKSETRLGESFVEKVEPPIIQEAKEVNNGDC